MGLAHSSPYHLVLDNFPAVRNRSQGGDPCTHGAKAFTPISRRYNRHEVGGGNLLMAVCLLRLLDKVPKGFVRITPARRTPVQEFRHVYPPLADFAFVNPWLRAFHPASQVALG
jgi:hypothetical protein